MLMTNFDSNKGWENDKSGWYTVEIIHDQRPGYIGFENLKHLLMVKWLYQNVPSCEKHCRWNFINNKSIFRFRNQRYAFLFSLRW